jgi:integrase
MVGGFQRKAPEAGVPKRPPAVTRLIIPTGKAFAEREIAANNEGRKHLEPAERDALWEVLAPDPFWNGYFRLQYHFGCRCSEVAIVMKEDVDFGGPQGGGRIIIRRLKKHELQTHEGVVNANGFSLNPYPLAPKLVAHLRGANDVVAADNPWFFGSPRRSRTQPVDRVAQLRITVGGWRAVSRTSAHVRFAAAAALAEIPETLRHTHVLRHTRATLLFAEGKSETEVQSLLGHSDAKTTGTYIGWAAQVKKRASVVALLGDD